VTVRDLLLARAGQDTPALLTRERSWTWRELVADASARAGAVARLLDQQRPPHVGLLMDNTPEMLLGLAAAGLGGHVAVGVNSTRRGDALVADLRRADVQLLLTDATQRQGAPPASAASGGLLDGLDLSGIQVIDTSTVDWRVLLVQGPPPVVAPADDALFRLIFTSGSSGRP
jgi:fatty-acyl-CoA synthase